ncbi:U32 family peptidase [Candidatus Gracilibacteria bacterium]|nr:U32 family peptidase [Candidatus Gracilibacteria bacterium]
MKLPELLLPAGDIKKAYYAFEYGADAIYCGVPMFALRTRANVFTEKDIAEIIDFANKNGKKVYITLNGFPHQNMIPALRKHLEFLKNAKPHGIILADAGVLGLANEICSDIDKHLSVQASTVSESGIRFWAKNGVKRIILAREIAIKEVKKIHEMFPEIELEYFVHGAVCMAYSGRCLLSNFMAQRDANRGMCAHSCRWNYQVFDEEGRKFDLSEREKTQKEDGNLEGQESFLPGFIVDSIDGKPISIREFEKTHIWEEEQRMGEFIPVEQDIHGTHIMSSRDMCMIEYLKEIIDSGVCSLKVEGRNKTFYYAISVARAYRKALDDIAEGKEFDKNLWKEIHATANRGFFAGFVNGKPKSEGQQYEANRSTADFEFAGVVVNKIGKGYIVGDGDFFGFPKGHKFEENFLIVEPKNRIEKNSELILVGKKIPDDKKFFVEKIIFGGNEADVLHGGNGNGLIGVSDEIFETAKEGSILRQVVKNEGLKK